METRSKSLIQEIIVKVGELAVADTCLKLVALTSARFAANHDRNKARPSHVCQGVLLLLPYAANGLIQECKWPNKSRRYGNAYHCCSDPAKHYAGAYCSSCGGGNGAERAKHMLFHSSRWGAVRASLELADWSVIPIAMAM